MLQASAVCVCVVAHDRWQSFELHSTGRQDGPEPDKGREMPRWFFLLSHVRFSSPSRCFSVPSLHLVTGGMVLTSEMPHGLFFFVSVFLPQPTPLLTVWHVRAVAVLPLRPSRARGGHRQAGGKGRVETVWSHAATMGSTGRNAQPGGCSGCCGPLSGVRTAQCMHMLLHST